MSEIKFRGVFTEEEIKPIRQLKADVESAGSIQAKYYDTFSNRQGTEYVTGVEITENEQGECIGYKIDLSMFPLTAIAK